MYYILIIFCSIFLLLQYFFLNFFNTTLKHIHNIEKYKSQQLQNIHDNNCRNYINDKCTLGKKYQVTYTRIIKKNIKQNHEEIKV